MTDEEIVKRAKDAEKRTRFGELVYSPMSNGVNSAYGIGFIEGMVEYRNSLQEEPKSIWRDANQQPTMYRKYLVRYSDGRVSGSWERHDDGFIPWKDVVKEHGFTHWCYVEDLLKL